MNGETVKKRKKMFLSLYTRT